MESVTVTWTLDGGVQSATFLVAKSRVTLPYVFVAVTRPIPAFSCMILMEQTQIRRFKLVSWSFSGNLCGRIDTNAASLLQVSPSPVSRVKLPAVPPYRALVL
jgi:hypothetical protein